MWNLIKHKYNIQLFEKQAEIGYPALKVKSCTIRLFIASYSVYVIYYEEIVRNLFASLTGTVTTQSKTGKVILKPDI
jgi:hypothetical protein